MTAEKRLIDQQLDSLEQMRQQAIKGGGHERAGNPSVAGSQRQNYVYLVHDAATGAVPAPGRGQPAVGHYCRKGWEITYIFNTHHHGDHTSGNLEIK